MVTARTVLVLDDDLLTLRAMGKILSGVGFSVHTAKDTTAARECMRTVRPDLVLADLELRGDDDSNEFVREVLRTDPAAKVLRITGKPTLVPEDARGDGVISKPLDLPQFTERMRSYVG